MKFSPSSRRSESLGLNTFRSSALSSALKTDMPSLRLDQKPLASDAPSPHAWVGTRTASSKSNLSRLRSTPCKLGTSKRARLPSRPGLDTSMPCICLANCPALAAGRVGAGPMGAAPRMGMPGTIALDTAGAAPGTTATSAAGGGGAAPLPCMEATNIPMERTSLMLKVGIAARTATDGAARRPGRVVTAPPSRNLSKPNFTPP
mmetsp:Transcript_27644/g.64468  ORF Transcript_27644/g.64468 Transcript_27644/m.64468 type:complete len:204 (-) Transcript_27644:1959-2570(-)